MRALVVGPEAGVSAHVARLLRGRGLEVCGAADPEAAVDACRVEPPQLAVAHLPPDALGALCLSLTEIGCRDRIALLALAVEGAPGGPAALLRAGADDVLPWPSGDPEVEARLLALERLLVERARLRLAEAALDAARAGAEREILHRDLLEAIPDAVLRLAPDGRILEVRPGRGGEGSPLLDARPGRSIAEALPPMAAWETLEGVARALRSGGVQAFTCILPAPGGGRRCELRLLPAPSGGVLVLVREAPAPAEGLGGGAVREAADLGAGQVRLLLADRLASVGTLAAGVAHEINNPLASVIANLAQAAEELDRLPGEGVGSAAAELRDLIEGARRGADRVRRIVRDLKTFARFDEDRVAPVDVHAVLDATLSLAGNEIRHRARLVRDYGEVPQVRANEARLGQVFLNVLMNAVQAMPEGEAERQELRITTRADAEGRVIVEVQDTGSGIAPEDLPRIFDPFYTTRPVGLGAGLGLSICHNVVTSLGGEIAVDSRLGQGTTVRIALPGAGGRPIRPAAGRGSAAEADGGPAGPLPPGGREPSEPPLNGGDRRVRVLVVDDEPLITTSLRRALRGHEVTVAMSGREALDVLARDGSFDLVLCDLMMPDLTGMDLYEELRRTHPGAEDRIVFMTGGAFTPKAREFLARVPNAHLAKPFDLPAIRDLVRERAAR